MLLYQIIIFILSPIILGHIVWLSITNKQSRYLRQRLGFQYSNLPKNSLWFHCASVGEINTLLPLLRSLHAKNDQLKIIITSNTITGGKIVAQKNLGYLFHCYLPFDWRFSVNRFISQVRPVSLNVMETEIWPNLFSLCSNKKLPVYIINARLSKKTTTANRWIKSLLRHSLSKVTAIYSRSEENTQAYLQLGAPTDIVETVGNLKLATAKPDKQPKTDSFFLTDREYILVASTHDDEEQKIYDVWKKLARHELLIIAPRHPQRTASILKQLNCKEIAIRSKDQKITDRTEIFLLDTVGELKNVFSDATFVIMGGSFVPIGGHNILEPASFNKAIITGPFMENFKQELDLMLDKKAIIQTHSISGLGENILKLLNDKTLRSDLENNTKELSHKAEEILQDYSRLILKTLQ